MRRMVASRATAAIEMSDNRLRPRTTRPHRAATKSTVEQPTHGKGFREGDVIVTAVAHHYAIGRIGTDGRTQEHLASEKNRALALALACEFAGAAHRVFLYRSAGDSKFEPCDCKTIR
jgi:hypothetical protein